MRRLYPDDPEYWRFLVANDEAFRASLTPRLNKYIPFEPNPMQAVFMIRSEREVLYGGAAGGGKSFALLMAALQYVDLPNYSALIVRRTFKELALPKAIMDLSHRWLANTDARWNNEKMQWRFPSGSTLTFGYLERDADKERYQGSEYQFIGVDELTQFEKDPYLYLGSRLRKDIENPIPLRIRAATNPGGVGGEWVKERFIDNPRPEGKPPRVFIPARLQDNPKLDQDSYLESLNELDDVTKAQLLDGSWDIFVKGEFFSREWFQRATVMPDITYIRFWDLAAQVDVNRDGDWTVGAKVGLKDGVLYIADIARTRGTPGDIENFVRNTALDDGRKVKQIIEQEAGAAGATLIHNYQTRVLKEFQVEGVRPKGKKDDRIRVLSGYAQAGKVYLKQGEPWISQMLQECELYPTKGVHDDVPDAISGGLAQLLLKPEPKIRYIDIYKNMVHQQIEDENKRLDPAFAKAQAAKERELRRLFRPAHLRKWD